MTSSPESISEVKIKTCKKCYVEFVGSQCRPCKNASTAAWRLANPDKVKKQSVAWRDQNHEKVKASKAAWNGANPDKVKAHNAAKYAKNPSAIKIKSAAWYANNKETAKATHAAYYAANSEIIKPKCAAYRAANPEKVAATISDWHAANPDARRIYALNRRAREKEAGGNLSKCLADKLFKLQHGKCACCKMPLGKNYHMDHIMPLAKGGSNTDDNMQLLTAKCNMQKSAKDPIEFMQSRGFLL